jgi:hypothetical protein
MPTFAEIKGFVESAVEFLKDLMGDEIRDIQVEEIKNSNLDDAYLITLSMVRTDSPEFLRQRKYKVFTVRKDTGGTVAMEIRQFSNEEYGDSVKSEIPTKFQIERE